MDPLSALGVAAAIVQFIDCGTRLIGAVYGNSNNEPNGPDARDVDELLQLSGDFSKKAESYSQRNPKPSVAQAILLQICDDCNAVGMDLRNILRPTSKNAFSKWDRLKGAVRDMLSDAQTRKLLRRLADLRAQMSVAAIACIM